MKQIAPYLGSTNYIQRAYESWPRWKRIVWTVTNWVSDQCDSVQMKLGIYL